MDKLRAMRFFDHVGRCGSFSEVARLFDVPVSSVTRQIQGLEDELGARLLHRTTRMVRLTEIGEIYFQRCQQILGSLDNADELVANYQQEPSGTLHISCSISYGDHRVVPLLPKLQAQFPKLLIDLDLTDRIVDINRDTVDIAIRAGRVPDDRVVAKYIDDNNFSLVASPAYIARFGLPETVADMVNHRAIFYRTQDQVLHWQVQIHGRWQSVPVQPSLITNSAKVMRLWAQNGEGMALMPNWAIQSGLIGDLQVLELDHSLHVSQAPSLGIYLLYQKPKYVVPKVKAAVDFFILHLAGSA
ncbi:LysR family transcriptional regulator [Hahella ganghwensis]|uniref:LysR family transcriptional regulator n=1 Tax=Hahella ganghwensis TaxID=286420 RepID=UPI00035C60E5|nr:LysR family transcriptional regulator [Hahella ganghwensis]